jgi:protein O-mannosyl-transferase
MVALLLAGTLALYGRVSGYPFINFDDEDYVVNNLQVRAGLTWQTIRWSLTAVAANNWHPVTWLSHALDCQFFGVDPGGPHVVNLLLHTVNVVLLFFLLQRATGASGRSFMVAALFAWHPFNVESVVWIAERKNLLSTLFLFLALLAYGWYARRPGLKRYAVMASLFALGLASKPMLVTLPVILLVLDYWPLQRVAGESSTHLALPQTTWRRLLVEKVPLCFLSLASCAITIFAQRAGGALESFQERPFTIRLLTAARSYVLYILKALWPSGFALFYPDPFDPTLNQHAGKVEYFLAVLGVLALVGVSGLAWKQHNVRPYLLTGWLWYVITLTPVIGVVQVGAQAMADRYAYVPLIGIFVLAVWGLSELAQHLGFVPSVLPGLAAATLAVACILTFRQTGYWQNSYELWQHTRDVTANNFIADDKIAILLYRQNNPAAFDYYQQAARIAPWDPVSNEAVAAMAASQGRIEDAVRAYQVVIRGSKDREVLGLVHSNVAILYTTLGDYANAQAHASEAMRLAPQRVNEEIRELSAELTTNPDSSRYTNLAILLEQAGQIEAARAACQKALDLSPDSPEARKFMDHLNRELSRG